MHYNLHCKCINLEMGEWEYLDKFKTVHTDHLQPCWRKCLPLKGSSGVTPWRSLPCPLSLTRILLQADPRVSTVRWHKAPGIRGVWWWGGNSWKRLSMGRSRENGCYYCKMPWLWAPQEHKCAVLNVTDDWLPSPIVAHLLVHWLPKSQCNIYTPGWLSLPTASQWGFKLVSLFFIIISTYLLSTLL